MNLRGIITRFINFLPLLLLTVFVNPAISQTPTDQDCLGAIVVCDSSYYQLNSYSGTGVYPWQNEINPSLSCLNSGEKNDVWYMITVQSDGDLGFLLTPIISSNDYDWAVYNLTIARCEDIYSNASLEVSCNYSAATGNTGPNGGSGMSSQGASGTPFNAMIPVLEGQTYVVNISNWSPTNQSGYTLDFGISTAQIYDNVRPTISQVYGDDITCGDTTIDFLFSENVMCTSVTPASLNLTGPGGPYTITNVYGEACAVGGDMEKEYTLTIDPPFSVNGAYSLNVVQFSGISDACGNIALPQQFPFDVDLGAPEIDESNMEISNSTCGQNNGTITDLVITGTPPFTYEWTNAGNIVGTDLDLINVSAGLYTLAVRDENTCESFGGPYQINDEGAPVIDISNMIITDNYCGLTDGSITNIQVTGSTALSYEWIDDNSNVVGTELDLTNIIGGTYILKVTDENSCEAFSDSYIIEDKPGPVIDETIMIISNASCNETTGSITNILVSGNGLTFEWTNENNNIMGNSVDLLDVGPGNYSLKTNN
ncbi:MAG: hypothetical protein K8R41_07805, partial [Bacteroidales bacterium]|nr:hypothetical protein [Bacteroidales bacterium]